MAIAESASTSPSPQRQVAEAASAMQVWSQTSCHPSDSGTSTLMPTTPPDQYSSQADLLRAAYAAFNARDMDAALVLMTTDVAWPRAFKGGFVRGPEEVRAYWTEQWSEIDPHVETMAFHPEDDGRILVEVHQVVRDMAGTLLADERVGHRFTLEQGLIQGMEVCSF